ncbi:hypothetical protein SSPO_019200 [Streptomyces antimycoticus]|uniref:Uncharacterized protein n=1 Tax=Streptomyces antimycoticus TaxID=68175 RepID=A0A499UFF1_9ACTN|nr:hypothetical protein SSPO_019200 [Streptomyces antimycoticus]
MHGTCPSWHIDVASDHGDVDAPQTQRVEGMVGPGQGDRSACPLLEAAEGPLGPGVGQEPAEAEPQRDTAAYYGEGSVHGRRHLLGVDEELRSRVGQFDVP